MLRTRVALVRLALPALIGLAILAAPAAAQAEGRTTAATDPSVLFGHVHLPDGTPAAGAVVVSSAGGQAVTRTDGSFELAIEGPRDAESVQVTASASALASTGILMARARVGPLAPGRRISAGRLFLAASSTCQPDWIPTFGGQPGTGGSINTCAVFDDGSGPALYVGGDFLDVGGVSASRIAKWNGTSWSPLGTGLNSSVHALAVFDDGTGPALYAGGRFSQAGGSSANLVAKWNGSSWSPLGLGLAGGLQQGAFALMVFDDGSGPALYAGGEFTFAGFPTTANRIARWNGATWSPVGTGMNGVVHALTAHDDGSGSALYAGGGFTTAGGVAVNGVAKWSGASWSPLGGGMNGGVRALASYDDGSGPALFASGFFTMAGGLPASAIAKWNGTSWSALGAGLSGVFVQEAYALLVFDDGSGPSLFVGGGFTSAGGSPVSGIARWNGAAWSDPGGGVTGYIATVITLTVFDDGSGPKLQAAGNFLAAGSVAANSVASWDGASWSALGTGLNEEVNALAVFDDGGGPALFAGGEISGAGGSPAQRVAKWNGTSWSDLGGGMSGPNDRVLALAVFDDGSGPALYVGGEFASAGGVAVSSIARWNGTSWSALGSGMGGTSPFVDALAVFDDGSGPALYAGGRFTAAGGVAANRIAMWNGTSWSALGVGMNAQVRALVGFDDGSGPALYAAGNFTSAGSVAASRIAKWKSGAWSPLGSGLSSLGMALAVFDDGNGNALYAGGTFTSAGGAVVGKIARWNGSSWSALGSGLGDWVNALAVFDDGSGPSLYAGGHFLSASGADARRIARWNGAGWSALARGTNDDVFALAPFDDGNGIALYAGGRFAISPAGDSFLAKWGGCAPSCPSAVVPYGSGTPGCLGSHSLGTNQCPKLGAASFRFTCDKAPASTLGLGIVTDVQDIAGTDEFGIGILLHAGLLSATVVEVVDFFSDASGHATGHWPIPNLPILVGQKVYAQAIWYWAGACTTQSPYSLSSSHGLEIEIQS